MRWNRVCDAGHCRSSCVGLGRAGCHGDDPARDAAPLIQQVYTDAPACVSGGPAESAQVCDGG
ncbi:hypothetical protein MOTT27_00729 [Mycobacterium intracellulare subsp. yongonense]|nr:hypothetical protein MOTT27_00729 [Mycobacterium intracellulare subsp. yongonense]